MNYPKKYIEKLNQDISSYKEVAKITAEMTQTFDGISRLIMLDRYAFKVLIHNIQQEGSEKLKRSIRNS